MIVNNQGKDPKMRATSALAWQSTASGPGQGESEMDIDELENPVLADGNEKPRVATATLGLTPVPEVFKGAIRRNETAILPCHNHSSNDLSPSPDDVQVTRMIVEAGNPLAIDVLNHLASRQ